MVAGIAEQGEGALGEFARGGAGEIAVQGIEFGQCLLVGHAIAVGERLRRRATAIVEVALDAKLLEQPLHLRRRVAGNLGEKAQQSPRSRRERWA